MGAFDNARKHIYPGAPLSLDGTIESILLDLANSTANLVDAKGSPVSIGITSATANPNLELFLDKLETLLLSGWKKDADGETYSKSFVEEAQRKKAMTMLHTMAQLSKPPVYFMPDDAYVTKDIPSEKMQGKQTTQYKLTVPAKILEPILQQEGMLDGPGRSIHNMKHNVV